MQSAKLFRKLDVQQQLHKLHSPIPTGEQMRQMIAIIYHLLRLALLFAIFLELR